ATDVVEGERTKTEAVIFEVELKRVLARRQRIRSLPARALEINKVVQEYGLALQHIEPVTAKSAALRYDHAFSTGLRDVDLGFVVERRVENAWRITVRRAGDLARPSELGATGGQVGARCHNPSRDSGIERFDLIFRRLGPETLVHLLDLIRILGGDVIKLGPIFGQIIEFVRETGRVLAHRAGDDPWRPHDLCACDPAIMIDRVVTHHFEILRAMP